nr:hypothetical protein [uncultured Capnocytophaga sp.]
MKKVILGLVAIAALVSCKKEDNGNDTTIQEGTYPKEVTYKDKDGKIIGGSIYTIEGGKIVAWSYANYENGVPKNTKRSIITYNGALPVKVEGSGSTETYTYDESSRLIKSVDVEGGETNETTYAYEGGKLSKIVRKQTTKTYKDGNNVPAIRYEESDFIYNGNRITVNEKSYIEVVADKSKVNEEVETTIYTVENGNVIKEEKTYNPSSKLTVEYTYDDKNNPSLNNLFKILNPDHFIEYGNSKNNVLTIVTTNEENGNTEVSKRFYEYNYNGDYPTTVREFRERDGNKELRKITEYKY